MMTSNVKCYLVGDSLIQATNYVALLLLGLVAYELKGSVFAVAEVCAVGAIPRVVVNFATLPLSDYFSRGRVIVACSFVAAAMIAVISAVAFAGNLTYNMLLGLQFLLGALRAIETATSNASMSDFSSCKHKVAMTRAVWRSTGRTIALAIGVLCWLGGGLSGQMTFALMYSLLAGTYFVSTVLISKALVTDAHKCLEKRKKKNSMRLFFAGWENSGLLVLISLIQVVFGTTFFFLYDFLAEVIEVDDQSYLLIRLAAMAAISTGFWVMYLTNWYKAARSKSLTLIGSFVAIGFVIQIIYPIVGSFVFLLAVLPIVEIFTGFSELAIIRQFQDLEGDINIGNKFVALETTNSIAPFLFIGTGSLPAIFGTQCAISITGAMGLVALVAAVIICRRRVP